MKGESWGVQGKHMPRKDSRRLWSVRVPVPKAAY